MSAYYHLIDVLAFQHQVDHAAAELKFRMSELIEESLNEIKHFQNSMPPMSISLDEKRPQPVPYRFSSVLAMLQTFRDALIGAGVITKGSSDIEDGVHHADLFRKLRNAIVHDGYRPISAWVEGRYYLPVNVKRSSKRGNKEVEVEIIAPAEDVETLCLQFAASYCETLAARLDGLPVDQKLRGLEFSRDWFAAAGNHPAIKPLLEMIDPSRHEDLRTANAELPTPLHDATIKLREIADLCRTRLHELESLPVYPFP
ncbi:hypothetical protein ACFDR9_005250 [Janthinobacterium sp. CG_23.3]|uniref:hypothetical protein n=1 Tax=Janthinobacterium sp. CG_23.3 TaxID=3349634 RepID=UPI0038D3CE59